jgi:hypothetical protein
VSKQSTKRMLRWRNMCRRRRGRMHWTLWRTNRSQGHMHSRALCLEHSSLEVLPHKLLHRSRDQRCTEVCGSCYWTDLQHRQHHWHPQILQLDCRNLQQFPHHQPMPQFQILLACRPLLSK